MRVAFTNLLKSVVGLLMIVAGLIYIAFSDRDREGK